MKLKEKHTRREQRRHGGVAVATGRFLRVEN